MKRVLGKALALTFVIILATSTVLPNMAEDTAQGANNYVSGETAQLYTSPTDNPAVPGRGIIPPNTDSPTINIDMTGSSATITVSFAGLNIDYDGKYHQVSSPGCSFAAETGMPALRSFATMISASTGLFTQTSVTSSDTAPPLSSARRRVGQAAVHRDGGPCGGGLPRREEQDGVGHVRGRHLSLQ